MLGEKTLTSAESAELWSVGTGVAWAGSGKAAPEESGEECSPVLGAESGVKQKVCCCIDDHEKVGHVAKHSKKDGYFSRWSSRVQGLVNQDDCCWNLAD